MTAPVRWRFCPACATPLPQVEPEPDRPQACPTCDFARYDNAAAASLGIVQRDDRFLLLRRAHAPRIGTWDVVGGFLQGGESAAAGLLREAREEIGVEPAIERFLGTYPSVYGETGIRVLGIAYLCTLPEGELQLSEENDEAGWFAAGDVPELAFPDTAAALRDAVLATR